MKEIPSFLRDVKSFNKLCAKINRDYKCGDLYMCTVCCPAYIFRETQRLIDSKGMAIGDAYRGTQRVSLTEEEKRKIVREILERGRR